MIREDVIQRLKTYTMQSVEEHNLQEFQEKKMLLAEDVFEENSDIFINVHTLSNNIPFQGLHGHDFFEMSYVVRGTCTQTIDSGEPDLFAQGMLCIMNPDAKHNLTVYDENDLVINVSLKESMFNSTFWTMLEQNRDLGQFFINYFASKNATSDYLKYDTNMSPEVEDCLEKICLEYLDRRPYCSTIIRCMLIVFFTEVVRSSEKLLIQKRFTNRAAVRTAALFQYLSQNYATATLSSTAEYFHYHPNYLSAFVKKNTGKTFRQILNDIKYAEATYYLTCTGLTMEEIAEKLGFSQMCNFYDFVRKNFHTTPGRVRREVPYGGLQ